MCCDTAPSLYFNVLISFFHSRAVAPFFSALEFFQFPYFVVPPWPLEAPLLYFVLRFFASVTWNLTGIGGRPYLLASVCFIEILAVVSVYYPPRILGMSRLGHIVLTRVLLLSGDEDWLCLVDL
jgi:hypothetical protein